MDVTYRIVFAGELAPGQSREAAVEALAKMFRKEPSAVAGMFDGRRVVLKKGASEAERDRYLAALGKAGLVVVAEAESAAPSLSLSLEPATDAPAAPASRPAPAPAAEPVKAPAVPSLSLVGDEEEKEKVADARSPAAAATMSCPACGFEQPRAVGCARCGVVIEKYLKRQAELAEKRAAEEAAAAAAHLEAVQNPYVAGEAAVAAVDVPVDAPAFISISFTGRLNRVRYLAWMLASILPVYVAIFLVGLLAAAAGPLALALLLPLYGLMILYWVRLSVLRLHDRDQSGWLALLVLVPLVNFGFAIYLMAARGTDGPNRHGEVPAPGTSLEKIGAGINVFFMLIGIIALVAVLALGGFAAKDAMENPAAMDDIEAQHEQMLQDMAGEGASEEEVQQMREALEQQREMLRQLQE